MVELRVAIWCVIYKVSLKANNCLGILQWSVIHLMIDIFGIKILPLTQSSLSGETFSKSTSHLSLNIRLVNLPLSIPAPFNFQVLFLLLIFFRWNYHSPAFLIYLRGNEKDTRGTAFVVYEGKLLHHDE